MGSSCPTAENIVSKAGGTISTTGFERDDVQRSILRTRELLVETHHWLEEHSSELT